MAVLHMVQRMFKLSFHISRRQCTSMAKERSNTVKSVYAAKYESKLLGMKAAMATTFDPSNVHHVEKSMQQIDALNGELKSFCKSLADSKETKIEQLHEQLQAKIRANKVA